MTTLYDYAKSELEKVEIEQEFRDSILDIISVFAAMGHSGTSAQYTIHTINRLLNFKPLTPLTGEDEEWTEISDGIYINKRCPVVFKDMVKKKVYNIDDSSTITFPYKVP